MIQLFKFIYKWLTHKCCDSCGKLSKHLQCTEEFTESGYYICDDCLYGPECYRHLHDSDYEQM